MLVIGLATVVFICVFHMFCFFQIVWVVVLEAGNLLAWEHAPLQVETDGRLLSMELMTSPIKSAIHRTLVSLACQLSPMLDGHDMMENSKVNFTPK